MQIDKVGTAYSVVLENSLYKTPTRFDTGAFVTVLNFRATQKLVGVSSQKLREFLQKEPTVSVKDVQGERNKATPCVFHNIRVGDLFVHKFYALVSDNAASCLLGFDFIDACVLSKQVSGAFSVFSVDEGVYAANFKEAVNSDVVELMSLSKDGTEPSPEQLWFVGLSNVDRQRLADYSPVLYAQLTRGVFTEELRILLDGFKNLYNL